MKTTLSAERIITSLLDTDIYKFYMQQAIFHHYPAVPVVAEFYCRDNELLGKYAPQIIEQVQTLSTLQLTMQEYSYLSSTGYFKSDYLNWLRQYRYQLKQISITNQAGQLVIKIQGSWLTTILWEVPLLAIISEIIQRDRHPMLGKTEALSRLNEKLTLLQHTIKQNPELNRLKFVEFGTRRRFSFDVQQAVVTKLQEISHFNGTSNAHLAHKFNLPLVGTQAHEWFQAHQRLAPSLAESQKMALQVWLDEYPQQLGIALTDCISMDAFLVDFSKQLALQYVGLRHDSGDALIWGEKALQHYRSYQIDTQTKTLVFSDSLNFNKMLKIHQHFYPYCRVIFGIGTFLSCDLPKVLPLNIVIKLTQCNGQPVTKLSDSPGKMMTQNPDFIAELRQAFKLPLEN